MEARRYIIEEITVKNVGIKTITATTTYDLTNSFSGVREDGSVFNYDELTLNDLSNLNSNDYLDRVSDFIIFLNITDEDVKNKLEGEAIFQDISCI